MYKKGKARTESSLYALTHSPLMFTSYISLFGHNENSNNIGTSPSTKLWTLVGCHHSALLFRDPIQDLLWSMTVSQSLFFVILAVLKSICRIEIAIFNRHLSTITFSSKRHFG